MDGSMFKSLDELREQIKAFGLKRHEEKLVALAKPAIRMLPKLVEEDEIPIGASKLGGNPDLPADFEWKYYEGKPLTFIGQFKLSEIAPYDRDKELPAEGMLYIFFEADRVPFRKRDSWEVYYIEDETTKFIRRLHPTLKGEFRFIDALPAHRLSFESNFSIPYELEDYELDFTDDEEEQFSEFYHTTFPSPRHTFLGHDSHIQNYPIWDCVKESQGIEPHKAEGPPLYRYRYTDEQLSYIDAEIKKWKFLFQIDSDDSLDVMWGDVGMLYICIPKTSLERKHFEDAWTTWQCH
jgi:uncharacterized protein YwqG